MGKENQDYFKVGGRTGGPAGSLRHFKERFAQEQARTHRLEHGRLPHERRPAEARPPRTIGAASGRPQEEAGTPPSEEQNPPPERGGEAALPLENEASRESRSASSAGGPPPVSQGGGGETSAPTDTAAHFGERHGAPRRRSFPDANTNGFGPPASEEMAVGKRPQRGTSAPGHEAPVLLREAARRYPLPFRVAAGIERLFDRRIRRALDDRLLLSWVERRLRRPISRGLDMIRALGETARSARRAARP